MNGSTDVLVLPDTPTDMSYTAPFAFETESPRFFADNVYAMPLPVTRPMNIVIDTPQFQRLRFVKQLGVSEFVFPSGNHNRFVHCIGVSHLAGLMMERLQNKQPQLHITAKDVTCVQLAGLLHDIGHGPFSHMFESHCVQAAAKRNPTLNLNTWHHEQASIDMIHRLWEQNPRVKEELQTVNGFDEDDFTFIEEAICGAPKEQNGGGDGDVSPTSSFRGRPKEKWFMYDIVSNGSDGFDVDKFDYVLRDSHATEVAVEFDLHALYRLINSARVCDVDGRSRICYAKKVKLDLNAVGTSRWSLHSRVYQHKTVKACEHLVGCALTKADPHFRITGDDRSNYSICESVMDMSAYEQLNDSILQAIMLCNDKELEPAKMYIRRLMCRQLDRLVGETNETKIKNHKLTKEQIGDKIVEMANNNGSAIIGVSPIERSDVIVQDSNIHRGMNRDNPLAKVYVYNHKDLTEEPQLINREEYLGLCPDHVHLRRIFVFGRYGLDEKKMKRIADAFTMWCEKHQVTPLKRSSAFQTNDNAPSSDAKYMKITMPPLSSSQE